MGGTDVAKPGSWAGVASGTAVYMLETVILQLMGRGGICDTGTVGFVVKSGRESSSAVVWHVPVPAYQAQCSKVASKRNHALGCETGSLSFIHLLRNCILRSTQSTYNSQREYMRNLLQD